jgi:hypothetical protein
MSARLRTLMRAVHRTEAECSVPATKLMGASRRQFCTGRRAWPSEWLRSARRWLAKCAQSGASRCPGSTAFHGDRRRGIDGSGADGARRHKSPKVLGKYVKRAMRQVASGINGRPRERMQESCRNEQQPACRNGRCNLKTLERVKGIEPSSSAWKACDKPYEVIDGLDFLEA